MSAPDTAVSIGATRLKNPVICGSGEAVMTAAGIAAALATGVGAVVAKSTNESAAAKAQLDATDYVMLDSHWRPLAWNFEAPRDAHLFNRSGLIQADFDPWIDTVARLDRLARDQDSYVVASLILADLATCAVLARRIEEAGIRVLELNIGAPHGDEAAKGAIALERAAGRVREIVATVRAAIKIPLWVKLTGQSEDVVALAAAAREGGADAVIMMGRFMALVPDLETRAPMLGTNAALGGAWGLPLTCRWLALGRRALGAGFPLIGTNGARDGHDVARFLLAGASAVEMTSVVMTNGFAALGAAVAQFSAYLDTQGVAARTLVGEAADKLQSYADRPARPGFWRDFVPPETLRED